MASEDEAFLAFLGGWEDANGEAATPLEWKLLLDDAESLAHENDAQVAEGVNNEPEQ